ncbi:MAG TPA: aminotransferase class V-fold PLP-dependent enzyme, partial [Acidimicrobiales bacterium]|nr:aminotransferase class V-fold PLP-dependent enzyme [Acidimicrobiales bacterium]
TRAEPGRPVLCAAVEHSAVRAASLRRGAVITVPVDRQGRIDAAFVATAVTAPVAAPPAAASPAAAAPVAAALDDGGLDDGTGRARARPPGARPALVNCQWANHEVGTVQPVADVVAACRAAGVLVHVDAAQAAGHLPVALDALGADLVSVSAHKFGGPPGTGALVVRRGLRIPPFIVGGEQERARRGGMENVAAIAGFGVAAEAAASSLAHEGDAARRQTAALLEAALAVPGVVAYGDPAGRAPHIVCVGVEGVEAEAVLLGLDQAGIAAHSGSACSSEALEPSPVLDAMGVDAERSLRLSVGWSTTDADIAAFASAFPGVVARLRALR